MRLLVAENPGLCEFVPAPAERFSVMTLAPGCCNATTAHLLITLEYRSSLCVRCPFYVPPEVNWFPDEAAGFTYEYERRASASSSFLVRRKSNEPARYSKRTNRAHYSNQIHPARAAAWHRARPIPNCHLKRAPDSPPLVPAVCLTPAPPEPDKSEGPPDRCGAVRCCSILRRTPTTMPPPARPLLGARPHHTTGRSLRSAVEPSGLQTGWV